MKALQTLVLLSAISDRDDESSTIRTNMNYNYDCEKKLLFNLSYHWLTRELLNGALVSAVTLRSILSKTRSYVLRPIDPKLPM